MASFMSAERHAPAPYFTDGKTRAGVVVAPHVLNRVIQLLLSCVVLGVGVALLLDAALGSDGYSALVNGLTIATGLPFALVNLAVGLVLIGLAWTRGTSPGIGTVIQAVLVGVVVGAVLPVLPAPTGMGARVAELAGAFVLVTLGVAGYLATNLGAGPAEAAAMAFDPPLRFGWSYSVLQLGGAIVGWALGAAVGPGTLLVVRLVGPAVDVVTRRVFGRAAVGRAPVGA
jgi:uncharacterized protein